MAKAILLAVLKVFMILIFAGWVSLWVLKPTNLWTRKWKEAEDRARATVLGYYGLNFLVYTFPVIALAIIGLIYLNFQARKPIRRRLPRSSGIGFSNPLMVKSLVGILSGLEILAVTLFVLLLVWTFYARISNDLKKLIPVKELKLNLWQLKYLKVATRFGLLAEACLALLLLPVLRGVAVFQLLGIQFEASVRYHIWLGTLMIFFVTVHGASTVLIWGVSHHIQDEMWRWQKTGRVYLAGELALVTGLVIWITSLPQIRRKRFEIFYYTHHLYIVFILLFLFHGGDRHFYMVFPGIFLFGLDKLLRVIQSRPETCILAAQVFHGKAMELILPKDPGLKYTPTSVIYMKVPCISKFQWHPFSMTSSSNVDDHTMSIMMKCEEGWTSDLYDLIQSELDSDADKMSCIPVSVEGPYGATSLDFFGYDNLLLIAGGIGITPFLSILKEIASVQSSSSRYRLPSQIRFIYVVKKSCDVCLLTSISDLLLNPPSKQFYLKLNVFVTQEESSNVTIRGLLNDLSLVRTVNFGTEGSKYAVHGLESSVWMAAIAALTSFVFLLFLICFNRIFVPSGKKGTGSEKIAVPSDKKDAKEKTPSSVVDLLLLASFIIAITCSTFVAIILRWIRIKKKIPNVPQKQGKAMEQTSVETRTAVEEHEIQFGGRPNFEDVFSQFSDATGGSDIGVLVCGPEAMKESVASLCQLKSQGLNMGIAKGKKSYFTYHSLNFTL